MHIYLLQIFRFGHILRPKIVLRFVSVASVAAMCYCAVTVQFVLPTAPYFRPQMCAIVDCKYPWDYVEFTKLIIKINVHNVLGLGGP